MRYVNIYSSARWVAQYETYHILTPEDISDIDIADAIMIRFPVIFKNTRTHTFEHAVKIWSHENACLRNRCPFDWICGNTNCACFLTPRKQASVSIEKQKDGNKQFYSTCFTLVKGSLDYINRLALFMKKKYLICYLNSIIVILKFIITFHYSFNNLVKSLLLFYDKQSSKYCIYFLFLWFLILWIIVEIPLTVCTCKYYYINIKSLIYFKIPII